MIPAQVLAAGLGTRLRPLTYEIPKPMVPVLDRPVMAHIVDALRAQGIDRLVANLHYFPDTIRDHFGDTIEYRYEEELLGTAGGVRGCRDFFGDSTFLVISGDALTDLDIAAFLAAHRASGGVATLAVKQVADTREYGVVLHDDDDRVTGFQEKPAPAEAQSDLGNCGIYLFEPEIFDYLPEGDPADWANDVFPRLLAEDVPFHIHRTEGYWNDVGSLDELKAGTFDLLAGKTTLPISGETVADGVIVGEGSSVEGVDISAGPVWVGRGVRFGRGVRLTGPLAIGDGVVVGDGVSLRDTIVFPETTIADDTILIGAITGRAGFAGALRGDLDA